MMHGMGKPEKRILKSGIDPREVVALVWDTMRPEAERLFAEAIVQGAAATARADCEYWGRRYADKLLDRAAEVLTETAHASAPDEPGNAA